MRRFTVGVSRGALRNVALVFGVLGISASMLPIDAQALPLFARQTGQNCVACHAGGQFPELTPYGRAFKLTGYTIGDRVAVPLSVMGYASYTKVSDTSKSDNPAADFAKNGKPVIGGGSVFAGGKITDNIGAFIQWTYDNYAAQGVNGEWHGHSSMDNVDIRYADRFISPKRDLIFGVSLNNNPSVSDPWNTASAWMQYVPGAGVPANQFNDAATPYPGNSSGGNVAGLTAYMYLNKLLYAELGEYRTANGVFSPFSMGSDNVGTTHLQGSNNPYWRLALTHEWGPHNIMVGTSGNIAHIYDDPTDTSDPNSVSKILSTGLDAQYQYILDPHTITAQLAYMRQRTNYSANTVAGNAGAGSPLGFVAADGVTPLADPNNSDTTNTFRAKLSYVYQAKYGGSLAYFNLTGSTNTANQTSGYDPTTGLITSDPNGLLGATALSTRVNGNLSGNPATRGFTYEAFWMPVQYARVGVQYTAYSKYNGATDNYDGLGRNASDNNTLFFYVWGAY
ncbi:cytochrome c [Sulfurimicrobium lacus]|uniref:Cytochrome c n=2 Tax=Sulfurimicrobium lacus TaxID=2715678 RepID=A0A6F8VCQ9_9PROT|nr:cytochrome c [Sulfurimicrobium lacus]